MIKTVEIYVSPPGRKDVGRAIASTYLSDRDPEYLRMESLTCSICNQSLADLGAIPQPLGGWPDVLLLVCDLGFHRLDELRPAI
jgi:hypothetical protein